MIWPAHGRHNDIQTTLSDICRLAARRGAALSPASTGPSKMTISTAALRRAAVHHAFLEAADPLTAVERLGFVQADPIRAPARAQDLILRQRVADYRADDINRAYEDGGLDEGMFYAYGFAPSKVWPLLQRRRPDDLNELESKVLAAVHDAGPTHPNDVAELGGPRKRNAWGGHSRAAKLALESLHRRGLLRVSHRIKGVRCYEAAPDYQTPADLERYHSLVMLVARVMGPLPYKSLRSLAAGLRRRVPEVRSHVQELKALVKTGQLVHQGDWIWPAGLVFHDDVPQQVRLLAPFDPLVWDRRRFALFWGWDYRFEAYTPKEKRVRGYYAMPLLYNDAVIGWANLSVKDDVLHVETGFVDKRPTEAAFKRLLKAEAQSAACFLGVQKVSLTG